MNGYWFVMVPYRKAPDSQVKEAWGRPISRRISRKQTWV